jgi:hypothetical protein
LGQWDAAVHIIFAHTSYSILRDSSHTLQRRLLLLTQQPHHTHIAILHMCTKRKRKKKNCSRCDAPLTVGANGYAAVALSYTLLLLRLCNDELGVLFNSTA